MIKDIKDEIREVSDIKPEFLRFSGNILWEDIKKCNNILLDLITDKFLKPKRIEAIFNDYNYYINDILDKCDGNLQLLIADYYIAFLQYIQSVCLKYELYEAMNNFKIYFELFEEGEVK